MRNIISICFLLLMFNSKSFGQSKKFVCGAMMASGVQVKLDTEIEINDSTILMTDIKSGNKLTYKISNKSLNDNSYKITDGVRDMIFDFVHYDNPPTKIKGKLYHYWLSITVNQQVMNYFGELSNL